MTESTSPSSSQNTALLSTNADPPAVILPPVYGSEKPLNGQNYNVDGRDMKSLTISGNSVNMGNPVVTTENSSVTTGNPVTTMGNSAVTTGSSTVENKNSIGCDVADTSSLTSDPFITKIAKINKEAASYMSRQKIAEDSISSIDWSDLKGGLIKADVSLGDISKIKSAFEETRNGHSMAFRSYTGRRRRRPIENDSSDENDSKRRKIRNTTTTLEPVSSDSGDETEEDNDISIDQVQDRQHSIFPSPDACRAVQRNHKICGRTNCRYHRKI